MSEVAQALDRIGGEASEKRSPSLFRELFLQFYRSDSEAGYSFVYVWLSNQFGHFMIGFAGTLFAGWVAAFLGLIPLPRALASADLWEHLRPALLIGAIWLLVWLAKEALDIGLAAKELAKAERIRGTATGTVSLEAAGFWNSVVRDSLVDGFFYSAGCVTAIAMHAGEALGATGSMPRFAPGLPVATFLVLLAAALIIMRPWLREKLAFDVAGLPFVTRFVLKDRSDDETTRANAFKFATTRPDPGHLVIIGPPKSGRTTIAVSLGVEAVLRPGGPKVAYTTLAKLLDEVWEEAKLSPRRSPDPARMPSRKAVRAPEDAELLIVDDVGARGASGPFVAAPAFAEELRNNRGLNDKCANKRVIWVVGDDPDHDQDWASAVTSAFDHPIHVETVKLQGMIPPEDRHQTLRR